MPEVVRAGGAGPSAAGAPRDTPRAFLAFDPGLRRIGVASGNTLLDAASPLGTLAAQGQARYDAIAALIRQWQPDALVVGVPCHPDGAPHAMTLHARRFARRLHGRFGLPVHEVDERYTTTQALSEGARDPDAAAAALILEQHLRSRRLPPQEAHDAAA